MQLIIRGEANLKSAPTYMANTARNFGLLVYRMNHYILSHMGLKMGTPQNPVAYHFPPPN